MSEEENKVVEWLKRLTNSSISSKEDCINNYKRLVKSRPKCVPLQLAGFLVGNFLYSTFCPWGEFVMTDYELQREERMINNDG